MIFANRTEAGHQLGTSLRAHRPADPVVVGLPRGGVPVAAEVARILDAPLEICVVRSLLAHGDAALPIGAVAEGGGASIDDARVAQLRLGAADVTEAIQRETLEVARLSTLLRDRAPLDLRGRDVILVDDGVASASLVLAAARSLRNHGVRRLDLAVPVGATEVVDALRSAFDNVLCLDAESGLVSIGARYREFWAVSEAEVVGILAAARRERPHGAAPAR